LPATHSGIRRAANRHLEQGQNSGDVAIARGYLR
jgi:hypothetical protein